jgi:hypothetical protein
VPDPYRNELETLRAENERLRRELADRRVSRPRLALGLAAVDVGLVVALRPWLNGTSDAGFWGSLAVVTLVALAAGGAAVGRRRSSV